MTAVQAEGMRGLGGYAGGMYVQTQASWYQNPSSLLDRFMAASKVLGEETVNGANASSTQADSSKVDEE